MYQLLPKNAYECLDLSNLYFQLIFSIMYQALVFAAHFVGLVWEDLHLSDFKMDDWFRQEDIPQQGVICV